MAKHAHKDRVKTKNEGSDGALAKMRARAAHYIGGKLGDS
jgi:hypothetical protein